METTVNGIKLWYESQGEGEPLVVTGGFYMAHHQFEFVTPYLSSRCRVINWDYQGTGFAERSIPEPDTVDQWVEQLRSLLDALGISRASLWGTANGALITFNFAAKYPDRVRKIISHPWYRSPERVKEFFQLSAGVVETYGFSGHVRLMTTTLGLSDNFLYSTRGREFEQWRLKAGEASTSVDNYRKMCEILGEVDLSDVVGGIRAPSLLLMGEVGPLGKNPTVDSQAQFLLERIPDCRLETIPNAGGTLFMVLKPEDSSKVVLDFLASD